MKTGLKLGDKEKLRGIMVAGMIYLHVIETTYKESLKKNLLSFHELIQKKSLHIKNEKVKFCLLYAIDFGISFIPFSERYEEIIEKTFAQGTDILYDDWRLYNRRIIGNTKLIYYSESFSGSISYIQKEILDILENPGPIEYSISMTMSLYMLWCFFYVVEPSVDLFKEWLVDGKIRKYTF